VYQSVQISTKLGCPSGFLRQGAGVCLAGFEDDHLEKILSLLKAKVDDKTSQTVREDLAELFFAIIVYGIFIHRFLNKNARLVLEEKDEMRFQGLDSSIVIQLCIKNEIERMQKKMQWFEDWRDEVQQAKKRAWEKKFIAGVTYRNMKLCIFGFLYYAEGLLRSAGPAVKFIPYLHANQSSLEGVFSVLRGRNRDSPQTVDKGLHAMNFQASAQILGTNNKMYSTDHVDDENIGMFRNKFDLKAGPRRQVAWLEQLPITTIARATELTSADCIGMFPSGTQDNEEKEGSLAAVLCLMGDTKETQEHYSTVLLSDASWQEIAKLGSMGPAKSWFEEVSGQKRDEGRLDKLCQSINWMVVKIC
jgi:hypothetical protein